MPLAVEPPKMCLPPHPRSVPSSVPSAMPAEPRTDHPSLLVVDDEPEHSAVLKLCLERIGCLVTPVTSAASALEKLTTTDFDLVLTDLAMDGMTGLELCQRILDVRPGMPVIVVTGQASMQTAVSALRAGAYDFITKPV